MVKRIMITLLVVGIFSVFLQGCAKQQSNGVTVGVSNGYIGNAWRTQMIENLEQQAAIYKSMGLIDDMFVQNAGTDINNQISQIRNMIQKKVDLLLINPNSETELNPVIEEAYKAGIQVIVFDQAVSSPYAINVVVNQWDWGARQAEWLCKELDGHGNIVIINGLLDHPANIERLKGMEDVLERYPEIHVMTQAEGKWDQITARQAMSDLLVAYSNIDGVLVQDSMPFGVLRAYESANKPLPIITGETTTVFLREWKRLKDTENFSSFAQNNPPGIGVTALGIGVRLVQEKEWKTPLKDNTFYYAIKTTVTNENLEEELEKLRDKPDTYIYDEWLTEEQLDALFTIK